MNVRLVVLGCTLAALPCAWYAAGKLHRWTYWIGRKTDAEVAALATGGWRVDRLEVAPGITLTGLVRAPRDPAARWILFVPGNSEAMLDGFRAVLDDLRGAEDVGMAFWAYRGFDASDGTPNPTALAADLLVQWRHLRSLGAAPERTEIWGYSLGSVLAVQLAAAVAGAGETPRRLVLVAAAEQIRLMRHGLFGRFLPGDVFDASTALANVDCPTVVCHGAADDALPIAGARRLVARLGPRGTLHELPGVGHADLWAAVRRAAF
ncbi:MAG TPA: alpha/beta hydrolase [Planctomycetota bacterium]|nr:alpha/beta hydrolase [Planctomycetota bacterium]